MELILGILWEKKKVYIEWRQIVCAVILAILLSGLCSYAGRQSDYIEKQMEYAVMQEKPAAAESLAGLLLLPETEMGADDKNGLKIMTEETEGRVYPETAAGLGNRAVSYDEAGEAKERDRTDRTGHRKTETKINTKNISPAQGVTVHGESGTISDTVPAVPVNDTVAGNTGILTGGKEDHSKVGGSDTKVGVDDGKAKGDEKKDAEEPAVKPAAGLEIFPGFLSNEKGHITGYTDVSKFMKDHLVVFPVNAACIGIERNVFKGLEEDVFEIYLPANITYIAPGAFDDLPNLYYIEAANGNSAFYSDNGILYHRSGKVAVYPNGLKGNESGIKHCK